MIYAYKTQDIASCKTLSDIVTQLKSHMFSLPHLIPLIQEGLLSVTSESMCTKYWLTAYSSLSRKKGG